MGVDARVIRAVAVMRRAVMLGLSRGRATTLLGCAMAFLLAVRRGALGFGFLRATGGERARDQRRRNQT